jgi:hypothetical protein
MEPDPVPFGTFFAVVHTNFLEPKQQNQIQKARESLPSKKNGLGGI